MPLHNTDIVENFNKVADLLEIKGANPFRVGAYRNSARTIDSLSKSVTDLIAEDRPLTDFSGIGKDLAEKIEEIVKTGTLSQLKALEKDLSPGLHHLLRIPGLGTKKVKALYKELDIDDLSSLKKAAQANREQLPAPPSDTKDISIEAISPLLQAESAGFFWTTTAPYPN